MLSYIYILWKSFPKAFNFLGILFLDMMKHFKDNGVSVSESLSPRYKLDFSHFKDMIDLKSSKGVRENSYLYLLLSLPNGNILSLTHRPPELPLPEMFSGRELYSMIDDYIGTDENAINAALVELFEKIPKYSYDINDEVYLYKYNRIVQLAGNPLDLWESDLYVVVGRVMFEEFPDFNVYLDRFAKVAVVDPTTINLSDYREHEFEHLPLFIYKPHKSSNP